ncbi:MAG: hypothetical protein ACOX2V_01060 [Clostridia bacterium]|jgi:hypothetical protein
MKKRIVSIVLLVVLLLGIALTVSAACDHTYVYIADFSTWVYCDDASCDFITYSRETCTKCHDNKDTLISTVNQPHNLGPYYYVGTLASGETWWYRECLHCGTRFDFFE